MEIRRSIREKIPSFFKPSSDVENKNGNIAGELADDTDPLVSPPELVGTEISQVNKQSPEETVVLASDLVDDLVVTTGLDRSELSEDTGQALAQAILQSNSFVTSYVISNPNYSPLLEANGILQKPLCDKAAQIAGQARKAKRELRPSEIDLVRKTFMSFGLEAQEADDIFQAWQTFDKSSELSHEDNADALKDIMVKNFLSMRMLEFTPGSVSRLYREFGIRHYGRYNIPALHRQLNGHEADSLSLAVSGISDWNGAFMKLHGRGTEEVLGKDLVFTEAGTVIEAVRRIIRFSRRAGMPLSTLLVSGHGTPDKIELGSNGQSFTKDGVEASQGLRRLVEKGFFTSDTVVILQACSTGVEGGFADSLKKATGLKKVLAPTFNTIGLAEQIDMTDPARARSLVFI